MAEFRRPSFTIWNYIEKLKEIPLRRFIPEDHVWEYTLSGMLPDGYFSEEEIKEFQAVTFAHYLLTSMIKAAYAGTMGRTMSCSVENVDYSKYGKTRKARLIKLLTEYGEKHKPHRGATIPVSKGRK